MENLERKSASSFQKMEKKEKNVSVLMTGWCILMMKVATPPSSLLNCKYHSLVASSLIQKSGNARVPTLPPPSLGFFFRCAIFKWMGLGEGARKMLLVNLNWWCFNKLHSRCRIGSFTPDLNDALCSATLELIKRNQKSRDFQTRAFCTVSSIQSNQKSVESEVPKKTWQTKCKIHLRDRHVRSSLVFCAQLFCVNVACSIGSVCVLGNNASCNKPVLSPSPRTHAY